MKNILSVIKPIGITPLEAIQEFVKKHPDYVGKKISYAGRLDPMASGVLVLLIDEENKKRKVFEELNKTYETEIILGISTDSFDQLGVITGLKSNLVSREEVLEKMKDHLGKKMQIYPPYSSKTVNGKPLYWWTRNEKLEEIELPSHEIEITSVEMQEYDEISCGELFKYILKNISLVKGDFRQEKIRESWKEFAEKNKQRKFQKIKLKVSCSSGTYIRRFADDLGRGLNTYAFALSINRTELGEWDYKNSIKLN